MLPHVMRARGREGSPIRIVAEQALSRAAGAPLVEGNELVLLRDAGEHFPALEALVDGAQRTLLLESYLWGDDPWTRALRDRIAARARAGVRVFVLADWVGCLGEAGRGFFAPLREAGAAVRVFNPPRLDSPFGWMQRDHRKVFVADGRAGIVTGLCPSARWAGDPARGIPPWRDTGVRLAGPAVLDVERAFAQTWELAGAPLPEGVLAMAADPIGDVAVRVIPTEPATTGLYRLDLLVTSLARERLWLADAYFVGIPTYVQSLCAAAEDGVDVRLLVPGSSDVPLVRPLSRAGYRPLLESGVRVFEWNGSMMHAKTAVADGRWARVGSTNLNLQSWLGNWELDVAIEDRRVAGRMEQQYEADLAEATEIVLSRKWYGARAALAQPRSRRRHVPGSSTAAAAGALRVGRWVGAALTSRRELGPAEVALMAGLGAVLVVLGVVGFLWPRVVAWPLAALLAWVALGTLARAWTLARQRRALRR